MKTKKKSLLGKVFGFSTIKQGYYITRSMLADSRASKKSLIKETFKKALRRLGIEEDEENFRLLRIYKAQKAQFIVFALGALVTLTKGSFLFIDYLESSSIFTLFSAISFFSLMLAVLSVSFHYSFRCFQIRSKRLGMLSIWIKTYYNWYPSKISKETLMLVDDFQSKNKGHNDLSNFDYLENLSLFLKRKDNNF